MIINTCMKIPFSSIVQEASGKIPSLKGPVKIDIGVIDDAGELLPLAG